MKSNEMNQTALNTFMIIITVACLLPFVLLIVSSLASEKSILDNGYTYFPSEFSLDAYKYLWAESSLLIRAYSVTIIVTIIGTSVGLTISALLAYPLSRGVLPFKNLFSFLVFFTLLFNGGLVPTYLVYTELFNLKNTLLSLIIPGLLTNGFFILLMRTFFATSIPVPIIESAYIDGASEYRIFFSIVAPLSLPIIATIGMMLTISYWNDWFNGLIYLTEPRLFSIQNLLNRMLNNIQFLQQNSFAGSNASTITAKMPTNGVRMAMAVVGVAPLLCIYPFFQKYFVKGLVFGAVKG